ncbi:Cyclin H,1 isoform 3 [Hibiscus syriacus]|uniref:Cyclin H,1 isoform 3 n=1 Tax=Hibiscus syriacus TaxID=106335 RepID=A0A6A2YXI0_HIBSY|nr:Cyclin H,1 isoform 3 [Hibiscus syriacus]
MADFHTSTHRAKWIFSPQELVEKYKTANQRAKQLEKYGTTQMEVDAEGSISTLNRLRGTMATALITSKGFICSESEFDLIVFAPYRSVEGFVNDMELALAALRSANEMHRVLDFEGYLRNLLGRQNSEHSIFQFIESLNAIDVWVAKYKFPTEKDMKHINRKLKSCWGHSSHDDKKREKKRHKSHRSSNEAQNGPSLLNRILSLAHWS